MNDGIGLVGGAEGAGETGAARSAEEETGGLLVGSAGIWGENGGSGEAGRAGENGGSGEAGRAGVKNDPGGSGAGKSEGPEGGAAGTADEGGKKEADGSDGENDGSAAVIPMPGAGDVLGD